VIQVCCCMPEGIPDQPMEDPPMNRVQFRLLALLLSLSLLSLFQNAMAKDDEDRGKLRSGALTLPLAGTVPHGQFSGTVTINRFAIQNHELVAVGIVRGTVTTDSDQVTGLATVVTGLATVVLPVTTGFGRAGLAIPPSAEARLVPVSFTGQFILAQAQSCGILHLDIGGTALNLLGFTVTLSPITLDISGDSAGPLGALVCEIVALLGTAADIVGLLNSLLGLLTGLLGGLTGGLGG
jgi:hypothetical protein